MRRAPFLGLLMLAALAACGPDCIDMPEALLGRWTAESPLYADRHMTITVGQVEFGTGGGQATRHGVMCVERLGPDPSGLDPYRIVYLSDEGEEHKLPLLHDPAAGLLRLANRKQVAWTREGGQDGS